MGPLQRSVEDSPASFLISSNERGVVVVVCDAVVVIRFNPWILLSVMFPRRLQVKLVLVAMLALVKRVELYFFLKKTTRDFNEY